MASAGAPVLQISDTENPKIGFSFDSSVAALEIGSSVPLESVKTGNAFTGTALSVGNSDSLSNSKRKAEVSIPRDAATVGDRVRVKVS